MSRIDKLLLINQDRHPYPKLVENALEGPKWFHSSDSGYRQLIYLVLGKRERVRHMRAIYGTTLRKISSDLWKEIKDQGILGIKTLLEICTEVLKHWTFEYRVIAFDWCYRMKRHYQSEHYPTFESWAKTYLTTWESVDDYCTHTMGYFLYTYPQYASKVKKWVRLDNPWTRRAAAVTFIYGLRRGVFLEHIFDISDALLIDGHKYVQWGYGWMLKEASKHFLAEVFEYVMRNKTTMPRAALRYAIEKMPEDFRAKAMEK
ncbi:MAG: DNA alkylation repair protein [Candidatus Bathyarchaeota archaeon]|nr:MAG: DNA alkylation repair protein [Candidatus Bathyarchaeota archaeon]